MPGSLVSSAVSFEQKAANPESGPVDLPQPSLPQEDMIEGKAAMMAQDFLTQQVWLSTVPTYGVMISDGC